MRWVKENPESEFAVRWKTGNTAGRKQQRIEFMTERRVVLVEKRTGLRRFSFEDWQEGVWLTPRRLYKELGDDAEATLSWINSCIVLGATQFKLNASIL